MRTIAYVDGYNLFFGCLKGTAYKWLDIVRLVETIIGIQDPASTLIKVKYFTAPIKARLASQGQKALQAQQAYHRALHARGRLEIFEGWYSLERAEAPRYQVPPNRQDRVEIWRLEEKETDVAMALQMYRDCVTGACEQAVLMSNDSDMVPAVKLVRQDASLVKLGLIIPRRECAFGTPRPPNAQLSSLVDWTRREVKLHELAASQLPARVPTAKKPVDKPDYW